MLSPFEFKPGDTYDDSDGGEVVRVRILREAEEYTDIFGRDGFKRFWAMRLDTCKEGYVTFGESAKPREVTRL